MLVLLKALFVFQAGEAIMLYMRGHSDLQIIERLVRFSLSHTIIEV